ncbi:PaaX family transcriptional regulator, partial [Burkholderia multivorans]
AKLVQLMGDLGYDAPGVRSAISRLKSKGILVSSKLGSQAAYSIDPSMTETIDKGDVRIFADTRPDSAGKWALVTFTVPETQRSLRHQIRSSLTRLGFGNAGQGLWIAPAANLHEAEVVLRRRGLDKY